MAAWTFAQQVLAELGDSVLSNLCESDCPYDPTERGLYIFFFFFFICECSNVTGRLAMKHT